MKKVLISMAILSGLLALSSLIGGDVEAAWFGVTISAVCAIWFSFLALS